MARMRGERRGDPGRRLLIGGALLAALLLGCAGGYLLISRSQPNPPAITAVAVAAFVLLVLIIAGRLQQEMRQVESFRRVDAMRSDFLATAQHELRNPMLAIMGQLELVTLAWDRWDEATRLTMIREIDASTSQLNDLIEAVMDFTRLSTETVSLRITSVAVEPAVAAALAGVGRRFGADLAVAVKLDIAPGLHVRADEKRFRQVLSNLLDNAIKFSPRGDPVTVRARLEGRNGVRIEIHDQGIGIGDAALPRIFDGFYREDNANSGIPAGPGLGLAVVRRLCQAHHATVAIASQGGRGTEVTLQWPSGALDQVTAPNGDGFQLSTV